MDRFDDDTLVAELRELRPTPRPGFAAELDERAAAGFPRRSSAHSGPLLARLTERLLSGRLLVPGVGLAIAALAAVVVVVAISSSGSGSSSSELAQSAP